MAGWLALFVGTLAACGTWLLLRARTFDVVLGLSLLGYAVNLFIFASGGVRVGAPPLLAKGAAATLATVSDPLPQALVLTAIVIGFAMTGLLLAIAIRAHRDTGSDHVDGEEPEDAAAAGAAAAPARVRPMATSPAAATPPAASAVGPTPGDGP